MSNTAKPMSLMAACRDFFGLKQNQTSVQFGQEYKALTQEDREEIKTGLEKMGYNIQLAPGAVSV